MAAYEKSSTRDEAEVQEFLQQIGRYSPKLEGETYVETLLNCGEQRGLLLELQSEDLAVWLRQNLWKA